MGVVSCAYRTGPLWRSVRRKTWRKLLSAELRKPKAARKGCLGRSRVNRDLAKLEDKPLAENRGRSHHHFHGDIKGWVEEPIQLRATCGHALGHGGLVQPSCLNTFAICQAIATFVAFNLGLS